MNNLQKEVVKDCIHDLYEMENRSRYGGLTAEMLSTELKEIRQKLRAVLENDKMRNGS